jgi:hypothetical protein
MAVATPLGGSARDPIASTINAKKYRCRPPWEVPKLEIRGAHHQCYETSTMGTLGGAGAGDPGAPTINAKNHR